MPRVTPASSPASSPRALKRLSFSLPWGQQQQQQLQQLQDLPPVRVSLGHSDVLPLTADVLLY